MQARLRHMAPGLFAVLGSNLLLVAAHALGAVSDELVFGLSGAFWRGVLMATGVILGASGIALLIARGTGLPAGAERK